jgi:hypothetical protein
MGTHRKFGQFDCKTTPDSLKTILCLQTFVDKIQPGESQVHLSARQMSEDIFIVSGDSLAMSWTLWMSEDSGTFVDINSVGVQNLNTNSGPFFCGRPEQPTRFRASLSRGRTDGQRLSGRQNVMPDNIRHLQQMCLFIKTIQDNCLQTKCSL